MTAETTDVGENGHSGADILTDVLADVGEDTPGEWLQRTEAAIRLGISERSLDRHLAQGKLLKRRRADGKVEVFIPAAPATGVDVQRSLVLLDRYNEALAHQVRPFLEKLSEQAELIGELKTENRQLRERIGEFEQEQTKIQAKPWWRFW